MTHFRVLLLLGCVWFCQPQTVQAQSVIPATDGTGTSVTIEGNRFIIRGGQLSGDGGNLFHSFSQFGLPEGQQANFLTNPSIQNILARIVGGNASFINGLISITGGQSNLFLINPAGIVFGQGARLDVPGSFLATTATDLDFGNQRFYASGVNHYSALLGTPSAFNFRSQTGSIVNAGHLAVGPGHHIALMGGTVFNMGTLQASGGHVTIAAIPEENAVRISQVGHLLSLEVVPTSPSPLSFSPLSLPELLTGSPERHATGLRVNNRGEIVLTASDRAIPTTPGTAIASGTVDVSSRSTVAGGITIVGDRVGILGAQIQASRGNGDRTATQLAPNQNNVGEEQLEAVSPGNNITIDARNSIILNDLPDNTLSLQAQRGDVVRFRTGGEFVMTDPNDLIQTQGGDITIAASRIAAGKLNANGGQIDLTGDAIELRGGVGSIASPGGSIRFQPWQANEIRLGGSGETLGRLDLTEREFSALAPGLSAIAIGREDGNNLISVVNPLTFNVPLTLQGNSIDLQSPLTLAGDASVTFTAPTTLLKADIDTDGGNISFGGGILLNADVALNTRSAGTIAVSGSIDGAHQLTLSSPDIRLNEDIGQTTPLANLILRVQTVEVLGNIATQRLSLDADGKVTLQGNLTTLGGVEITAENLAVAGKVTTNGNRIHLLGRQDLQVGSIESKGGEIQVEGGNVSIGNLNSALTNGPGGPISVSSSQGSIALQDVDASGVTGGNVEVRSRGGLTAEAIRTSSNLGAGGNVVLNAGNNIEIGTVNAQGGRNGSGGNITIVTPRFFRANSTFQDLEARISSLSTIGSRGSGSITIQQGSGDRQPFIVGDSSRSGTQGTINAGGGNLILPDRSFTSPYRQGNPSNQIAIITGVNSPDSVPNPSPSPSQNPSPNPSPSPIPNPLPDRLPSPSPIISSSNASPSPSPNPIPTATPSVLPTPTPTPTSTPTATATSEFADARVSIATNLQGEISTRKESQRDSRSKAEITLPSLSINIDLAGILKLEENLTRDYEKYLELPAKEPIGNLSVVYDSLRTNEVATGVGSAIIYMNWVPNHPATPENQKALRVATTANSLPLEKQTGIERESDRLELIMVTASGQPLQTVVPNVARSQVLQVVESLHSDITNPQLRNTTVYLESAQQLYRWLIAPLEKDLQALKIKNLMIIPASGLRSIPFAALHDGQQFLIENYSLSLIPSLSLTDPRYEAIQNRKVLAMGASIFSDKPALPAVPVELKTVAPPDRGEIFLNEQFTLANLQTQRATQPFGIVHLATHSEFKPGQAENSYIQFWDTKLQLNRMRQLQWNDPPVDLLVLSACSTALGDEQAELGFAGLAVASGARSALASLWEVSDEGTLGLMLEFYEQLRTGSKEQPLIKAEALRRSQLALLRGLVRLESGKLRSIGREEVVTLPPEIASRRGNRLLMHPYYWAAFTIIGNPW